MLPVFGVSVSVMFHLKFVHYTFSSIWIVEWPTFGKELLILLAKSSLCILSFCNFSYFPFLF